MTSRRWIAACAVAAGLGVNLAMPEVLIALAPRCPLRTLTGWECPGCGSTRALSALARGDLAAAWRFNPLAVAGTVLLPIGLLLHRLPPARGKAGRGASGRGVKFPSA
jgi:hypothetical protein